MKRDLPTLIEAKAEAKRLRADRATEGVQITHAQALEKTAHRHGFRDWNALHAAIRDLPPEGWSPGGRVTGTYLSQPFAATVLSSEQVHPGWFRLVLNLDEAVDVVGADLRVYGVDGLRVADASIFPTIPSGNTNAPSIMVGERASDLISLRDRN